jgi:N-acetylglucosaminyldiphosphoundecaprenol N-acetyl-beta-D-mannosaminyltransferase
MDGDDQIREAEGPSRQRILGMRVDAVGHDQAVRLVVDRAMSPDPGAYVCLTNVHTTIESQENPEVRQAAESAFLSVPDGMPLVWILRRRGFRHVEKVTGIEYMPRVARAGKDVGLRHYFFGGPEGLAAAAARGLAERVPGIECVGSYSPPFSPWEGWDLAELHEDIRNVKPHIMWVGIGAPRQELWMKTVADRLEVPVLVGVGAAFDFLSGSKKAAPRWLSRIGLEWLFRLLSEPRRLWHRYLVGNSRFAWLLLRDALRRDPGR